MTRGEGLAIRVAQQSLASPRFDDPAALVAWMGAVQAQDVAGARWAIGMRLRSATDAALLAACDEGRLLRTHVLRPTWHLVAPQDIRWLLALTAPRVHVANGFSYRTHGLDARRLARGADVIGRALQGHRHLTRTELGEQLRAARLPHAGSALAHVVMFAELEGLICSGPMRGRQFTYALIDERVPPAAPLAPDEAVGELARRYFTSHGPATLRDFVWWSGLTTVQARRGIAVAGRTLERRECDGREHWLAADAPVSAARPSPVFLLPNYDEFLIAYRDRQWTTRAGTKAAAYGPASSLPHQLLVSGRVEGAWRRRERADAIEITIECWRRLTRPERQALAGQARRLEAFAGRTVTTTMNEPA